MIDNREQSRLSILLLSFNLFVVRLLDALPPTREMNTRTQRNKEYKEYKEYMNK